MRYCPNYSVPVIAKDKDGNDTLVARARCKQWSCGYCAAVNRRVWVYRIGAEIERDDSRDWTFLTITLPGYMHYGDTGASLHYWRGRWDRFMKRLKREYGKFAYLRVFETHDDGTLHVHMLMGCAVPDAVPKPESDGRVNWRSPAIRKHAEAVGFAWRHDARPLKPYKPDKYTMAQTAGVYLSKYLTKSMQSAVRADLRAAGYSRVRMIQTSRGWAKLDRPTELDWSVGTVIVDDAIETWAHGNDVVDVSAQRTVTLDDYHGHDHYPNRDSDLLDRHEDKL